MLARYLDSSHVGDPMALIIGLSGTFSLWILGRCGIGATKSLNRLLLQIKDQPAPHESSKKQLEPKLYYKLRSTRSRKWLPEESYTRSNQCKDCDCVYVGQTSRALKTRVKEHAKAKATLLAKHHMLHSHQIDWRVLKLLTDHRRGDKD